MSGFDNEVVVSIGERLEPSSAQAIGIMQTLSTDVARINFTGNPNGSVTANPSSLSHDPVSGNVYFKQTGTGNTGWVLIGSGGGFLDAFSAYKSSPTNNATGDGTLFTIVCDTALTSSANYNTSTGVYTAPATGIYLFTKTICFNGADNLVTQYICYWNGSAFNVRSFQQEVPLSNPGTYIFSDCIIIPMTSGDTMGIQALASGGSKDVQIYGSVPTGGATTTLFSGQRIK